MQELRNIMNILVSHKKKNILESVYKKDLKKWKRKWLFLKKKKEICKFIVSYNYKKEPLF